MTARRIVLIASSYAPHVGGVETHVAEVARELVARGDEVEVWTVDRGERPAIAGPAGWQAGTAETGPDAVVVRYLPTPLPARRVASAARFVVRAPGAWRRWGQAHRRFRPDVLHVHCFGPNGLYALALHRRFGTPLVVTSHGETRGDDEDVFAQSALLRRGLRAALSRAAAVTAPSEYVLDDLRSRFGLSGGEVVPNGVAPALEVTAAPLEGRYIATVRRLGWMKGVDLLVSAFALARDQGRIDPEVRLAIGGDGPERERLAAQIRAAGLDDVVVMLGWQEQAGVAALVAGAEAVVVPSRDEAFGIAALEAWRGGSPLIMTTRGGAAEFLTDDVDALLVDPEDTEALAAALQRVTSEPALRARLAAAGSDRVRAFTWSRVAGEYARIHDAVS